MNYSIYAQKALKKIKQYGSKATIIRTGEETYNKETNEYESEDTEFSGYALLSSYSEALINETTIKSGDVRILSYLDDEPKVNDVITVAEKEYTIISVSALNPDGKTNIVWTIQGRLNG